MLLEHKISFVFVCVLVIYWVAVTSASSIREVKYFFNDMCCHAHLPLCVAAGDAPH